MPESYPLKSPRGRGHNLVTDILERVEDGIYVLVSILLVVAGAVLLWSATTDFFSDLSKGNDPLKILLAVLDKGLILFIIAELLHTVRITIQERTLVAEPFLIVGLIAGIRRILILTAQSTQTEFKAGSQGVELVLLIILVLVMTGAVILYRRFYSAEKP
ncbi:MAG: phosphate-starvation-inducible PsiE family protein [Candidatus Dormibacteraeota bacterium]|nr:phosphate-starvation-inducible PsiE family protein [Candidatus Dormibacteraeota bacterium]